MSLPTGVLFPNYNVHSLKTPSSFKANLKGQLQLKSPGSPAQRSHSSQYPHSQGISPSHEAPALKTLLALSNAPQRAVCALLPQAALTMPMPCTCMRQDRASGLKTPSNNYIENETKLEKRTKSKL